MEFVSNRAQGRVDGLAQNRRGRYIINPAFQWRIVLTVALVVFLASSIISFVLYCVLQEQARARLVDPTGYMVEVPFVVVGFSLVSSGVAAAGAGIWCVLLTHRICGPLLVMHRWFAEVIAGRQPQLRPLRRNDEFKEFHQTFCKAVDALAQRRAQSLQVLAEAVFLVESALTGKQAERAAAIEALPQRLRALHDLLSEPVMEA